MTVRVPSFQQTALSHMRADHDCAREWECACAACRCVRAWPDHAFEFSVTYQGRELDTIRVSARTRAMARYLAQLEYEGRGYSMPYVKGYRLGRAEFAA